MNGSDGDGAHARAHAHEEFTCVDKSDYPKLKVLLSSRLPESVAVGQSGLTDFLSQLHNAVQLALTGTSEVEFYTYRGRIHDDALIAGVCYVKGKDEDEGVLWAYLCTANPTNITEQSAKAFVAFLRPESQSLSQSRPMMIATMRATSPFVIKSLLDRGATVRAIPNHGFCYPLDKLGVESVKASPGLIVKSLEPQHAALVASTWNYGLLTAGGTEATIRGYILRNPSAAVFRVGTGTVDTDEPLSWATCYDFGKVAMLYTPVEHRGRGYASLVMKRMVAETVRRGLIPTSVVSVKNSASLTAMSKAGYEKTHEQEFIFAE